LLLAVLARLDHLDVVFVFAVAVLDQAGMILVQVGTLVHCGVVLLDRARPSVENVVGIDLILRGEPQVGVLDHAALGRELDDVLHLAEVVPRVPGLAVAPRGLPAVPTAQILGEQQYRLSLP